VSLHKTKAGKGKNCSATKEAGSKPQTFVILLFYKIHLYLDPQICLYISLDQNLQQ